MSRIDRKYQILSNQQNVMNITLKNTLLASTGLAVALNLIQFGVSYQQKARASFEPTLAQATPLPAAKPEATKAQPISAEPTPDPAPPTEASRLSAAGLKPEFAELYLAVEQATGTPWELLAAVHRVETGQAGDTAVRSYAGASGPMQFMPATFAHYALDGDANGIKQISDLDDAMYTAGRYLAAGGADKGSYRTALYHYNHSYAYVDQVLAIARRLGL